MRIDALPTPTGAQEFERARSNAMNFNQSYKSERSERSALWKAALLFILVSSVLIIADQLSIRWGLDGARRIVDDLLGGLIAGAIFHLYERQRLRRLNEHLRLIDLANHHIRNALQPLMFVTYGSEGKGQTKVVEECVRRIDWALREVLAGKCDQRFVTFPGGLNQKRDSRIASRKASTSWGAEHTYLESRSEARAESRPEPIDKTLFSRWLDAWRSRNEKAS
jgi:hypothetical protein